MSMTWTDYLEETMENASEALEAYGEDYDDFESFFDALMLDDAVTGNASGSFTFNAYEAQENVSELIWDDEIISRFEDFGYPGIPMERGAETIDVFLRCFALDDLYSDLEDLFEELHEDDEDEDEDEDELVYTSFVDYCKQHAQLAEEIEHKFKLLEERDKDKGYIQYA